MSGVRRRVGMTRAPRAAIGLIALVAAALVVGGCSTRSAKRGAGYSQEGMASYYAHKFDGRPTASGEIYNEKKMTAAHRDLAFGTDVRVTNLSNNKSVVVRVNDRGPFVAGRIIDVSFAAAQRLDFVQAGVVKVRLEVVD